MNIFQYQEKINKKYPDEDLTVLEYVTVKEPGKIRCNTCGKIYSYTVMENSCRKSKKVLCQQCGTLPKKYLSFCQSLKDRYPSEELTVLDFTTRERPCDIKCNKCGDIQHFNIARAALERHKFFCKQCHPFKRDMLEKSIQQFTDFIKESNCWELVSDLSIIQSSSDTVECKCLRCGTSSFKTIYDYKRGRGCSNCAGNALKTTEQFKSQLEDGYTLLSDYKNSYEKVLLKHSCGFVYSVTPHNYLAGKRCPKCSRKQSKGEIRIKKFLDTNEINYIQEYLIKIDGHQLRMDFYLPEQDRYIEFQGEQHYYPIEFFGGEIRFIKQQEYDNKKRNYCGNKLIEISYTEINDIEDILTSILKSSTTIPTGSTS